MATPPPRPKAGPLLLTAAAALAGLLLLAGIAQLTGLALFALPFAATAGIVATAPSAPFAQPRSILLGHLTATVLALAVVAVAGPSVWAAALAAGLSVVPMMWLRAPHPPAGATAALIALTGPAPEYLVSSVLPASLVIIGGGFLIGRLLPGHRYPAYWW
ncbi:HPP family protein [Longispora albida]|uniref:HPP family protein n=1 Tax=Longispora albida TaxID=203523 RepID=UPI0003705C3E|nr:HPP family protein [Longispora albida]